MPTTAGARPRPKAGIQSNIWISPGTKVFEPSPAVSQGEHQQETGMRCRSRNQTQTLPNWKQVCKWHPIHCTKHLPMVYTFKSLIHLEFIYFLILCVMRDRNLLFSMCLTSHSKYRLLNSLLPIICPMTSFHLSTGLILGSVSLFQQYHIISLMQCNKMYSYQQGKPVVSTTSTVFFEKYFIHKLDLPDKFKISLSIHTNTYLVWAIWFRLPEMYRSENRQLFTLESFHPRIWCICFNVFLMIFNSFILSPCYILFVIISYCF